MAAHQSLWDACKQARHISELTAAINDLRAQKKLAQYAALQRERRSAQSVAHGCGSAKLRANRTALVH